MCVLQAVQSILDYNLFIDLSNGSHGKNSTTHAINIKNPILPVGYASIKLYKNVT